eukprot:g3513.t1
MSSKLDATKHSTRKKISLKAVKESTKKIRKAWPGGKVSSNKDEALRRFLERKKKAGGKTNMSKWQLEALERTKKEIQSKNTNTKTTKESKTSNVDNSRKKKKTIISLKKATGRSVQNSQSRNKNVTKTKVKKKSYNDYIERKYKHKNDIRSRLGGAKKQHWKKHSSPMRSSPEKKSKKRRDQKRSMSLEKRLGMSLDDL